MRKNDCESCCLSATCTPLASSPVPGASVIVVLPHPTLSDYAKGGIALGGYGKVLRSAIADAGVKSNSLWLTYMAQCFDEDADESEMKEGYSNCYNGLLYEIAWAKKNGARVILAVGEEVAKAFKIDGSILKTRGSVYEYEGMLVVPTYDPTYIMRGNQAQYPLFVGDIKKALIVSQEGWQAPEEHFIMFPTIEEVEAFAEDVCSTPDMPLAFDLETTSLDPFNAKIIVAGFATDEQNYFAIPFMKQGSVSYWDDLGDQQRAWLALKRILETVVLLGQNLSYDLAVMWALGIKKWRTPHDILLMHHVYHPELPHNLGFIGSQFAETPYWKDAVLGNAKNMKDIDDTTLRTYNGRDCVVLHQIFKKLETLLYEDGTYRIYDKISRRLIRPTLELQMNGMHLLSHKLPEWQEMVKTEKQAAADKLFLIEGISPVFKISSPHHMRWLIFGAKPASYVTMEKDLLSYDEHGCKKKKNTKVYSELVQKVTGMKDTVPLCKLHNFNYLTTDKGSNGIGKQALVKMKMHVLAELEKAGKYKRPPKDLDARIKEWSRFLKVVEAILEYQKWAKLATTYMEFNTKNDGRIHPSYKIHGTATGRLASAGPRHQLGSQSVMAA